MFLLPDETMKHRNSECPYIFWKTDSLFKLLTNQKHIKSGQILLKIVVYDVTRNRGTEHNLKLHH